MAISLITGGAGFIGSNIARVLINEGHDVRILDNFITGKSDNLADIAGRVEVVKGDIRNCKTVKQALKDVDVIFHQAALASVPRSIKNPVRSNEVNVAGTLNVFTLARDGGVEKVVYASSSSVYGDTPRLPKKESMTPSPMSPYAVTKLTGEHYCRVFSEIYGLKTVSLRYFNVYGPRQDPCSEYAAVIPKFISAILGGEPPVIFGDGAQSRDFTYVKDVVRANILAMEKGDKGEVFNVGRGERITINELAQRIAKIAGQKVQAIHIEPRQGDVRHSLADISKARKCLGYQPRYSIEEGLRETIRWFKRHGARR